MGTVVRKNERSWAIELISQINNYVDSNDFVIKKAGGESTVSVFRGNSMFPDVILYGDKSQSVILQGWELKMPDVPIENEEFIKDAWRKADALDLNSCLIWNFTYVVLYVRDEKNHFVKVKQWDETSYIQTRDDVYTYREEWSKLLRKILLEINDYFVEGRFRKTSTENVISSSIIESLIQRNKQITAENLRLNAGKNAVIGAYIENWWNNIRVEYESDELDMYSAYSKTILLNWANRIIFAHIIKRYQNGARKVNEINYNTTPEEANEMFREITEKCDYFNVFAPLKYNEKLSDISWQDLVEYSLFLKKIGIENLDQSVLQNILEGSVSITKRMMNGQFATPYALADILARLTIIDWSEDVLDCCCGTGTIAKAALNIKKEKFNAKQAVDSVWACDKYSYPLQAASISMSHSDTVNLVNRLFKNNALDLHIDEEIEFNDPETGEIIKLKLPPMGYVISNLPFVEHKYLSQEDVNKINILVDKFGVDFRSDLYQYIALKIADVIKPSGRLGIITSNSWLGTKSGGNFVAALNKVYDIEQVHISSKGRWFKNADVVATIIVLKKKDGNHSGKTTFYLWKKSLDELSADNKSKNTLVNSALLNEELDDTVVGLSSYNIDDIERLTRKYNLSYNAFFHKIDWINVFSDKVIPIDKAYRVFRGSRRGWDKLFYPERGTHKIEVQYLEKVLLRGKDVKKFISSASQDAFCCGLSKEELKQKNHFGALEWIEKFEKQKNTVGVPLPECLKKNNIKWYELKRDEIAEIFTMMNPDKRFFFGKFKDEPAFINQRLIGLTHKSGYDDIDLNFALLNSVLTVFSIEASGFGRGLGVLDINATKIKKCIMLNPKLVSSECRKQILETFSVLKNRTIKNIDEELVSEDRIAFEKAVFSAFGLESYLDDVIKSFSSMQKARRSVK